MSRRGNEESSERPVATDDSSAAGFAVSAGVVGGDNTDPEIRYVELRRGELDGAFWDDEVALGDNFEELHRWLGISRDLYDGVMAWNAGPENWEKEQQLLRRLRDEVPVRIEVAAPRAVRPQVERPPGREHHLRRQSLRSVNRCSP